MNNDLTNQNLSNTQVQTQAISDYTKSLLSNSGNTAAGQSTNAIPQAQNTLSQMSQPQSQAQPQQGQGNWLTQLLPTAGSILGGLVPIPGLDIATAGLGGALGKGVENLIEGKPEDIGGILASGAEGAAGQGIGAGISKVLGMGGKALGDVAAKTAESQAVRAEGASAAKEASDIRDAFMGVKPKFLERNNLTNNAAILKSVGGDPTNPSDYTNIGNTAANLLSQAHDTAMINAGPVSLLNLSPAAKELLDGATTMDKGQTIWGRMLNGGDGQQADPLAVRQGLTDFQKLVADAKPTIGANGIKDPRLMANYRNMNSAAQELRDTLYSRPGVNENFTALKGAITPDMTNGNQKLADHLNSILENAKTHDDILAPEAGFIQTAKIGQEGDSAAQNAASAASVRQTKAKAGIASSKLSTTPLQGQSQGTIASLLNLPNLAGLAESTLGGNPLLGGAIALAPHVMNNPAVTGALGEGLNKVGGSILPDIAGQVVASSPNQANPANQSTGVTANMDSASSLLGPLLQNELAGAETAAQHPFFPGSGEAISALNQFLPIVQRLNAAQQAVENYQNMYNQAGGAQGPVGGLLSSIGQTLTGGPASLLNNQLAGAGGQMQNALSQAGVSTGPTPSIFSNQQTAQGGMNALQNMVMSALMANPNQSSLLGSMPMNAQ